MPPGLRCSNQEFTSVWETAFDVTDPTFDCIVNRTKGDATTQMYVINHFLDEVVNVVATSIAPNKGQLNVTNSASGPGSLGLQASQCGAQYGRNPNFMLVDVRRAWPFIVCFREVYRRSDYIWPVLVL